MTETEVKKSVKSMFRDEEVVNYIVVPPDGGWGWIIVAVAFLCNVITDGITYSLGIFLTDLSKEFDVSMGSVTMTGSMQTFFYYIIGPFVSALLNRFGFRFVAITGSCVTAIGYSLASICEQFSLFVFCGGVLTGVGFGMISIPTVIICGFYFEKWRAIATGIATCGSGIGTMLAPPLITYLIDKYAWRNTYRIMAGLVLITGVLALLYRPLLPIKAIQDEKEINVIEDSDTIGSYFLDVNKTKCCSFNCRRHHNINYPTTAEVIPVDTVVFENPSKSDDVSSYSFATYTTGTMNTTYPSATQNNIQILYSMDSEVTNTRTWPVWFSKCVRAMCCGHCETVSRPMYRDDIFFGHSLMLLPKYKESIATHRIRKQKMRQTQTSSRGIPKIRSTGYHMSVTRVTTHREIHPTRECTCPLAILRTLSTMLDLQLLKSFAFQLFLCSGVFIAFGYLIPYFYIKDRAIADGISPNKAFWLLSAIGLANTVGRIISGIIPSVTNLKVIQYSYVCIMIAGVMTLISGLWTDIKFEFFYACTYGMAASCIATLRPIIVVELFGLEHLTNAFGLQLLFMAVAGFLGTTVAGMVYDQTEDFNTPFYISGGSLIIAAFLLIFIRKMRIYEKNHHWSI